MDILTTLTEILFSYSQRVGIKPILPNVIEISPPTIDSIPSVVKKKTLFTKVPEPAPSTTFVKPKKEYVPNEETEELKRMILARARTRFTQDGITSVPTKDLVSN